MRAPAWLQITRLASCGLQQGESAVTLLQGRSWSPGWCTSSLVPADQLELNPQGVAVMAKLRSPAGCSCGLSRPRYCVCANGTFCKQERCLPVDASVQVVYT